MPYKIKKKGSGYRVTSPNHPHGFSKHSMTKKRAKKQLAAIMANTNESGQVVLQDINLELRS